MARNLTISEFRLRKDLSAASVSIVVTRAATGDNWFLDLNILKGRPFCMQW